jgi:glycosyltransferase involved in cell wall biosynthesis
MRPIPDTSVLLPCYNAGKTLEETLASIHSQTYTDYELICVDDGSTDNTLNILQERARHDSRLEVIPEEHGGVIKAANR